MSSIRQKYFEIKNINNKYINENSVKQILMSVNNIDNDFDLLYRFDDECVNEEIIDNYVQELINGKPLQYILKKAYFHGHYFYVDNNVLIPRNETEELVDIVIKKINEIYNRQNVQIFDVCCGSGCIGISLKKAIIESTVYLSDISIEALKVSEKNKVNLEADVTLLQGDMLEPFINSSLKADVIVSNPPYIPSMDTVDEATLKHEPHLALFASPSTHFYELLFKNASKVLNPLGLICLEIGEDMEEELTLLIKKYFVKSVYNFYKDMYDKTRFLIIIRDER